MERAEVFPFIKNATLVCSLSFMELQQELNFYPFNGVSFTRRMPNVTLCYKVKMPFLTPKFNQILMKIENF